MAKSDMGTFDYVRMNRRVNESRISTKSKERFPPEQGKKDCGNKYIK